MRGFQRNFILKPQNPGIPQTGYSWKLQLIRAYQKMVYLQEIPLQKALCHLLIAENYFTNNSK